MENNTIQTLPSIRAVFPEYFPQQSSDAATPSGTDTREPDLPPASNTTADPRRKYACGTCGKRFQRPSSLVVHIRSHTGEKPYPCPHLGCGRRYQTKSNMTRHIRVHGGEGQGPGASSGGGGMSAEAAHEG